VLVTLSKNVQLSTAPIKGAFLIRCYFPDGSSNTTTEIGARNYTSLIRDKIHQACPYYRDKFEVWDGPKYTYYDDGRDLMFRFTGLNEDIPQFEIIDCPINKIDGNEVSFNSSTHLPYDPATLFYEPVPFEFLHTNETSP